MNQILALFAVVATTVAKQEAIVTALKTKNVLSEEEIRLALPSQERVKEIVNNLREEYLEVLKKIEASE